MIGFFIILLFLVIGNVLSWLLGGIVPGSVIGMLLLFVALCLKWVKPHQIRQAVTILTGNMSFFFVPAMVGIMEQWGLIRVHLAGWLSVLLLSTLTIMITSGWTLQSIARLSQYIKHKEAAHA